MPLFNTDPKWNYVRLPNNVAITTTGVANITGLSFTGAANTNYEVEVFGAIQSAATTTGMGIGFDIPNDGSVVGLAAHTSSASAISANEAIADGAVTGATGAVRAADTNVPVSGKFLIKLVTGGTVQAVARTEIADSTITFQGGLFYLKYRVI